MGPEISVIVPVYNGEKWIEQCINGVLSQTYTDWELIVVDDGSNDETFHKLENILQVFHHNSRIINVIHKENGGVSSARNIGIEHAQGEYIAFIDVDDEIEPTYLENLIKGLGYDMVITGFSYDKFQQNPPIDHGQKFDSKEQISSYLNYLLNTDHFCFPWARMFKTSIIRNNNVRFDTKMRFAEDHVFNWTYMCYIQSLYIDNAISYCKKSDVVEKEYNLSFGEMEYVDKSLYSLKCSLEKAYRMKICPSSKTFCHVLFSKDYIIAHPCSFYADYYRRYHKDADEREVYDYIARNIFHPGLQLVKQGRYTYRQMNSFLDEPWKLFKNTNINSRIYIPFVKCLFF